MKKLFITSMIALMCSSAFAQFQKGRILAGGNVGFSATTYKVKDNNSTSTVSKTTTFNFSPKAGYFFIDNFAAGAGLNLSTSSTKYDGTDDKNTYNTFTITPFARYYLDPGIFFQGQFGIGPGSNKDKNGNTTTTTKFTASEWSLGVGYAYFLNDNVAIEPLVSYGANSRKFKSPDVKDVTSGLFINIGLQVYLDRKK